MKTATTNTTTTMLFFEKQSALITKSTSNKSKYEIKLTWENKSTWNEGTLRSRLIMETNEKSNPEIQEET